MPLGKPDHRPDHQERPSVLFLNRSFWPDTEATGQLLTDLAVDLTCQFNVTVIAGSPNHVDGDELGTADLSEYRGVKIKRAWHTRFAKYSSVGRLLNLFSFAVAAWMTARRINPPPQVIIVETDPFFLPLVGDRLRRRFNGSSLICYLQDLYPDIAVAVGKIREGFVTRTLRRILFSVYRRADKVIVLSRDMQQRCVSLGVPERILEVIPNWADTDAIVPQKTDNPFRRRHELQDRFVVMYSGNMGLAHELDSIIDAAAVLRDRTDIVWVFIGDGARRNALEDRAAALNLSNVRFLPYQPRSSLGKSLSAADVHLVSMRPLASPCVMPSKLYGILASGTPTIALAETGSELQEVIQAHDVGLTCEPNDSHALASHVQRLADDRTSVAALGRNARRLAEVSYSRTRQTARFAEVLVEVLCPELQATVGARRLPDTDGATIPPESTIPVLVD